MKISPQIATRTHCFRDNYSVSLIYDTNKKIYYLLKGIGSILWKLIVEYQDFQKLELFAAENGMRNELYDLLFELKEKEIINTGKIFKKTDYKYLTNTISYYNSNCRYFYLKWAEYVCGHGNINSLVLELNYKCNLKCRHCYNHKNIDDYMSFNQAKKAIDEAYDMGISLVKITGGECTLNKDFLKIAEYIRSKYLELFINTNGQILNDNEELLYKLTDLHPSVISLSLYSMNSSVHDYITGVKGSWEKTVNVIKRLRTADVDVNIATPVLSYNKNCYKAVSEFANSIGAKYGDNCLFINNPDNNNLLSKLETGDIEQYYKDKFELGENIKTSMFEKTDDKICEAGYERLCITPNLDITPCTAMYYVLGNLKSTALAEVKATTLVDFRKNFIRKNLKECFNEEYCKYCFYCSDTACFNNTFMKKQPILCENAKAYYNAVLSYKKRENSCE